MRILVISDTHEHSSEAGRVIGSHPEAQHIIFLGDGLRNFEKAAGFYSDRVFHLVRGNCDFDPLTDQNGILEIALKRIFYTHGHLYHVKMGLYDIKAAAKRAGADILLFGHTHESYCEYDNGLYIMNPGSLTNPAAGSASYGIVDITQAGTVTNVVKI